MSCIGAGAGAGADTMEGRKLLYLGAGTSTVLPWLDDYGRKETIMPEHSVTMARAQGKEGIYNALALARTLC